MTAFVLIHGAYQGGWIWGPVTERLRAEGHVVHSPSMDGCGERSAQRRPGITTESQAEEIAQLLFYEDLSDIVLVGTSSGGMVVAKTAELARERVARLVFVDALVTDARRDHRRRPQRPEARQRGGRWAIRGAPGTPAPGPSGRDCRVGGRALRRAPRRGIHPAGRAGVVLGPGLGRLGDLVPARRESRRGAPAPLRGGAWRTLARTRHRPLPDDQRAGCADTAPSWRGENGPASLTRRVGAIARTTMRRRLADAER